MKSIQKAVAAFLAERTGLPAAEDRSRCRQYPMLAVSVRSAGSVVIDGGRQAERSYLVSVTAASGRDREENTALLSRLASLLLEGVPMGERTLHPLDVKTEGEALTFSLTLCVPLPRREKPNAGTELGMMEKLWFDI